MANITVSKFEHDDLELYVDESTGLAYAHRSALKRMLGIDGDDRSLRRRLEGVAKEATKTAEILTHGGVQGVTLYPAEVVFEMALEFCPDLARKMGSAGANVFMCGLAGYQTQVFKTPQTFSEALLLAAKQQQQIELQQTEIKLLEETTERQAEVIDELFDYSSILRIAKYNGCSEKAFSWHKLKTASLTLGLEIKKAPSPRYDYQNLYSHDAWRLAYPEYRLPETTTLRLPEV